MFTVNELKKIKFSKATMGGYKANEVDDFLTDVTSDFSKLLKSNEELEKKVKVLTQKVEEYRIEEDSIKSALVSAKQLGDKIVSDANEKAEALQSDARIKAESTLSEAKSTSNQLLKDAETRSRLMIEDAKRESAELEENLKLQCIKEKKRLEVMKSLVSKFKAEIIESYKSHIEILKTLPEIEAEDEVNKEKQAIAQVEELEQPKVEIEDISSDTVDEIYTKPEEDKTDIETEDDEPEVEDKMPMSEILADVSGETITFSKRSVRGDDDADDEEADSDESTDKKKDPYIPSIDIVSYEAGEDDDESDDEDEDDDNGFGFSDDDVFSDGFNIDTNAFDDDEDDDEDEDDGENYGFFKPRR